MFRQFATSALAIATLSVAAVGVSSPASAATLTVNFANCQAAFNGQTINVAAGEDLLLTFDVCPIAAATNLYLGAAPRAVAANVTINGALFNRVSGTDWSIEGYGAGVPGSPLPGGTYTVYYWLGNAGTVPVTYTYEGSFTVIVASPAPDPAPTASGSGPASVIQQFGKPATGTCDANQPDGLDWAGVPSGGWAESWAEWMNGGAGGAVCTRTLVYRGGNAGWGILETL